MPIKVILINNKIFPEKQANDCILLRMFERDSSQIDMVFPFGGGDMPHVRLSITEALDLKNAIDQLVDLKMLEKPRGNN
ncbi:hypothetical protein [Bacillus sp. T33-2]|uniref:hypothetical protein n=1 Tax=Bacillus sp. T33-2 TaxID=2054168 RepID=UPI000C793CF5|nr:hypothetical protein [Bacillus sp. T33-2]PLR93226.1 hypothetical protein CVD19_19680 [Bacillus sp. T33-2]